MNLRIGCIFSMGRPSHLILSTIASLSLTSFILLTDSPMYSGRNLNVASTCCLERLSLYHSVCARESRTSKPNPAKNLYQAAFILLRKFVKKPPVSGGFSSNTIPFATKNFCACLISSLVAVGNSSFGFSVGIISFAFNFASILSVSSFMRPSISASSRCSFPATSSSVFSSTSLFSSFLSCSIFHLNTSNSACIDQISLAFFASCFFARLSIASLYFFSNFVFTSAVMLVFSRYLRMSV